MADPTDQAQADEVDESSPPRKDWRKELEDRAKLAEAEAADLKQKLAINEAGLSTLSDRQRRALLLTHEGDLTADALKATAAELGFGATPPLAETPDNKTSDDLDRLADFQSDASPAGPPASARAAFEEAVQNFKGTSEQYHEFLMKNSQFLEPRK